MSKPLADRLRGAKEDLHKIDATIQKSTRVVSEALKEFKRLTVFAKDIDHWLRLIETRAQAKRMLTAMEDQVDGADTVPLGGERVDFQHARFIGVQAYLATKWAIADRISSMAGHVLCARNQLDNRRRLPQLVSHFVCDDTKKVAAALLFYSMKHTFGWPLGISYALRNHFCHDGGVLDGTDFFEGTSAASGFAISKGGWQRVAERAEEYGVDITHHRVGAAWPVTPYDDLRVVLDVCEREVDDALGVLVGSACKALASHIGFIIGEL